jgi:hypothetical protein
MHAYKRRPDESYVPTERQRPAAVGASDGDGATEAAHPSPARAMHDELLNRLSTPAHRASSAPGLSYRARLATVIALAIAAWVPVIGISLIFFG